MTTIAYRDGIIASDSQGHANGLNAAGRSKVHDINGWLLGGAGASSQIDEFISWFTTECQDGKLRKPPSHLQTGNENSYTIMAVNKKSRAVYQFADGLHPFRINGKYFAIGSGMPVALGALAMGATAEQAIRCAAKHDVYTSGAIQIKKCFPGKSRINPLKVR